MCEVKAEKEPCKRADKEPKKSPVKELKKSPVKELENSPVKEPRCTRKRHTHGVSVPQMAAANVAVNGLWNVHLHNTGAGNTSDASIRLSVVYQ